jgi:O-antigen/teichoic acid export membrane protein
VIVNFILGIISLKVISVYLGTSGMALTGSFRNFTTLFKSLSTNGFSQSLIKLFVENKEDKKESSVVISTFFWLFIIVSVFLGILIILFSEPISYFVLRNDEYAFYIKIFGLILPFVALQSFMTSVFNGLLWFKKIVFLQIVSSVVVFIATVSLIYYHRLEGAFIAIALADFILFLIVLFVAFQNKAFLQFDLQYIIAKKHLSVVRDFSIMALLSGIIVPLNFILIRNLIIDYHSIQQAGIWDAVNRISGFYMLFFTTGLSFYYIPKLSSIHTNAAFKSELKNYFKTIIPIFMLLVLLFFFLKDLLIQIALTEEFQEVKKLLFWQLFGDFLRLLTLAFGYQILVKTMMKKYIAVELLFNISYFVLSYFMIQKSAVTGALQAYCIANFITFCLVFWMFRNTLFSKRN